MQCCAFDIHYSEAHDKMSPEGWRLWVSSLLHVAIGGCVWFATRCSSFSWMSRYVTKRSRERPWGKGSVQAVRDGNAQVMRLALQMILAHFLEIHFIVEQPMGSILNYMPPVEAALDCTDADVVVTWLGSFGAKTPKPLKLMGSAPFLSELRRTRPNLKSLTGRTYFTHFDKKGRRRVTGLTATMESSSAYPRAFGEVFAEAFKNFVVSTGVVVTPDEGFGAATAAAETNV